jgi:hypothetical protein
VSLETGNSSVDCAQLSRLDLKTETESTLRNVVLNKRQDMVNVQNCDSYILCNYKSMLNYLHFETLSSRLQNIDVLFLNNVFKNKIYCWGFMDTVGLRVTTRQVSGFFTSLSSKTSQGKHSARRVTATKEASAALDLLNMQTCIAPCLILICS